MVPREKAVVRQEFAAVTGRQHNFIPFAFLSTPVLQCAVLGVVDQAEPDGIFSSDVGVQAALVRGSLFWLNSDDASNDRSDAIGTDNQIMVYDFSVLKDNLARVEIDVAALDSISA